MLELFRLSRTRSRSPEHYRAMQAHIAEASLIDLEVRGYNLSQLDVLELGAGHGGYSAALQQRSKTFLASDIYKEHWFDTAHVPFMYVDVRRPFPFRSSVFDLIYCSSLIEHVADPLLMLREARRVLRPGGVLFLSFPPFYSLFMVGGHWFKPFHFLGERLALCIYNWRYHTQIPNYAVGFGNFGLYPLTIDQVAGLLSTSGFAIRDTFTRMSRINTARWPGLLKDLATWHVCFIAQSPSD